MRTAIVGAEALSISVLKWSKDEYNLLVLIMWTAFAVLVGVIASVVADVVHDLTDGRKRYKYADWSNGWDKEMQQELRKPKQKMDRPRNLPPPKR